MISSTVSRVSALLLFLAGVALLFASDTVLPALVPGFPPGGAWLGQLLAAAWLGTAALNWLQRRLVLGGIYGRPVVFANLLLYFVSAMSLVRVAGDDGASFVVWLALVPSAGLALAYGALLMRGPFDALDRRAG